MSQISTFKIGSKPSYLQNFDSSVDRFPSKYYEDQHKKLGPGQYELKSDFEQKKPNPYAYSFNSGRQTDLLFGGNQNPGPGEYRQNKDTDLNQIGGKAWS